MEKANPMAHTQKSEFERGYDTGFLVGAEKGRTLPIPESWQLVPKEPDWKNDPQALKFLERINRGGLCCGTEPVPEFVEKAMEAWHNMLAAAPEYKP